MPRVTIGVPVYNAESLLEQCLENLAAQTFQDFKVIVLDNASTDGTAAIAQRFADRDPRFAYRRQPHNKGAFANFVDVLGMADTPYFVWRADDDASDVNFIEEMVRLLDTNPKAALAVGRVLTVKGTRKRTRGFLQRLAFEPELPYAVRLLLLSRASWIYGLFRTADLKESLGWIREGFPHFIGFDHLVMYPFLITGRVVGTNASTFTQHIIVRERAAAWSAPPAQQMLILRRDFKQYCRRVAGRVVASPVGRVLFRSLAGPYSGRTYRWPRIVRAWWHELSRKP
jgi:glycosyltransferase involved in cell wall biosynthesis